MADSEAKIKVSVDAREARRQTDKAAKARTKAEKKAITALNERAATLNKVSAIGGTALGGRGAFVGAIGATAASKAGSFLNKKMPRAATGVAGVAAALGAAKVGADLGVAGAEIFSENLLEPLVEKIALNFFGQSQFVADRITQAVADISGQAIEDVKQVLSLDRLKAQTARLSASPLVAQFSRAGDDLSFSDAWAVSGNFYNASLRASALERQEDRRSAAGYKAAANMIASAF